MDVHLIAFGLMTVCLGGSALIIRLVPQPEGPIDTSRAH